MEIIEIKKNDIEIIEINAITNEGNGVSRLKNNMAVFVPMTAIGDIVKVQIVLVKKRYAYGKIIEIITSSKARTINDCPYFGDCGGCSYRHIAYKNELDIKKNLVAENIKRIGGLPLEITKITPSPLEDRYRNKATYPIGKGADGEAVIGFYAKQSNLIISVEDCKLQPEIFKDILIKTKDFIKSNNISIYNKHTGKGLLRHLYIRRGEKSKEIMVGLVINGNNLPFANEFIKMIKSIDDNIKSIFININKTKTNITLGDKNIILFGEKYIKDTLLSLNFKLSPLSFFQVNRQSAESLYKIALKYADVHSEDIILDLYCGVGTIGLLMAKNAKKIFGVDVVKEAINNAKKNAEINNIYNSEFITANVETIKSKVKNLNPSIVVIDPPRKGSDEATLKMAAKLNPKKIIMVSCDSATLARDLKYLEKLDYTAKKGEAVDMFPRTTHVESVVLVTKNNIT